MPKTVLRELGWLGAGNVEVMFSVDDKDPEVVTLVPYAVFERRYRRGEAAERQSEGDKE